MRLPLSSLLCLTLMISLGAICTDLYLPSLPRIINELNTTETQVQRTLTFFMVGLGIGQLIYGNLSDRYGRLPLLYIGLSCFILSSSGCFFSTTIQELQWFRLLQGIGASCAPSIGRAIIGDIYGIKKSGKVLSYITSMMALLIAFSPILGGYLLVFFNWHSLFLTMGAYGTVILILATLSLKESNKNKASAGNYLHSYKIILKAAHFWRWVGIGSLSFGAMFAYITANSFIYVNQLGIPEHLYGYTFSAVVVGYICGSFTGGYINKYLNITKILLLASSVNFIAIIALITTNLVFSLSLWSILLPSGLFFTATGLMLANSQGYLIQTFPKSRGACSALAGCCQILACAIASIIVGIMFAKFSYWGMIGTMCCFSLSSIVCYVLIHLNEKKVNLRLKEANNSIANL